MEPCVTRPPGRYERFDPSRIRTYPIKDRPNKVRLADLVDLGHLAVPPSALRNRALAAVAAAIRRARAAHKPVIAFIGAHPIKLGLGPVFIDLIERGLLTHVAGTGATAIHDFELALIGETSENVPDALPRGRFGMARETAQYMNAAFAAGFRRGLGLGESVGRLILGEPLPHKVRCKHPDVSVLAAAVRRRIPVTIHVGIGTDIIDQHPSFDGAAKGGASGIDFAIYVASVCKLTRGGVVLNIGSAVTGPEVLLKAVSMATNAGTPPRGIVTADFDLRPVVARDAANDARPAYYFRDHKSVVTRIPAAFSGKGHYIRGHFARTIPALYRKLVP